MTLNEAIKIMDQQCSVCGRQNRDHDMREFALCQRQVGEAMRKERTLLAPVASLQAMIEPATKPKPKPEPEPYNGY